MEQNFSDCRFENVIVKKKKTDESGCFDCNICLDSVHDPVVSLCGHLFCWPCIFQWLHVQSCSSNNNNQQQQQTCPVCKVDISETSLVPLYGRGLSGTKKSDMGIMIPRRPPPSGLNSPTIVSPSSAASNHQQIYQSPVYFPRPIGTYPMVASANIDAALMTSFFNSTIGIFGEMFYENSYPLVHHNSLRMRRQAMHAHKSLNRVSIFLSCSVILCLLLF